MLSDLPRVTQPVRGEPASLADYALDRLLICLSKASGAWENHRPIETVNREKEHLFIRFSFHLSHSSKRKPLRRWPEKRQMQCFPLITTPDSYSDLAKQIAITTDSMELLFFYPNNLYKCHFSRN